MLTALEPMDDSLLLPQSVEEPLQKVSRTIIKGYGSDSDSLFGISSKVYTQQYAGIYFSRLNLLRPRILAAYTQKIDNANTPVHVPKVLDVKPGQKAFIIGTLYVTMPLKPSILDSVTRESWILPPPPREKYTSEEDSYLLEDESGRLKLLGEVFQNSNTLLVTGVVAGFVGEETASGEFIVSDIIFPLYSDPERPLISKENNVLETDAPWIAFFSGLNLGKDSGFDVSLQLLIDFLSGEVGSPEDRKLAGSIGRLVIAGNSVQKLMHVNKEVRNKFGHEVATFNGSPLRLFDTLLNQVCSTLDVDLMPGKEDPAPTFLPQPPLHHGLLPKGSSWSTLHRASNPHSFSVDSTNDNQKLMFLGTSGQNLDDMYRFLKSESRLDMAEAMLKWAHLAPTAPDTLQCHPFKDSDPFILDTQPDVFFLGNQPRFETRLVDRGQGQRPIRILLVPRFSTTQTLVLLNSATLDVKTLVFGTASMEDTTAETEDISME